MCGFVSVVNWGNIHTLRRMTDLQAHRGPDDHGDWDTTLADGTWVGLGSRRLSIVDLSPAGHMPMATPDGRTVIAYNGEIYNYTELREELEAAGYKFRSHSDTEVVLYLYDLLGPESVAKLNGMFAIAIWDDRRQHMFLARDHFGIKPLYYCHRGDRFAAASEIKSILELPNAPREINYSALHKYIAFVWVPDPETMFDGIYKLPAGHYATFRNGKMQLTEYWDLKPPPQGQTFPRSEADLTDELRERFGRTVRGQLRSDVPVGAFLSAGLDSSSVVSIMAEATSHPVHTFTVTFPEEYQKGYAFFDDAKVAQRTARHFGCDHTQIDIGADVADLLPKLIWHLDEPIADPAILGCYLVNRAARSKVTVLLSGNGGDEIFAGYRKYVGHYLARRYERIPLAVRRQILEPLVGSLPPFRGRALGRYVRLAKKLVRNGSLAPRDRFIENGVQMPADGWDELYVDAVREKIHASAWDPGERHQACFDRVSDADFLNQMLYVDSKLYLTSLNCTYTDKMSMAASVETRVPFLDWELAQWTMDHVPPGLKLNGRVTKHILREAMRDKLPEEIFRQPKAGFGAPVDFWLAEELREMVDDLLSESRVIQRGLFRPETVQRYVREQRSGKRDRSTQIWQLLTLELWMQTFLDNQPVAAPAPVAT